MSRLLVVTVSLLCGSCTAPSRGGPAQVGDLPQETVTTDSHDNEINGLSDEAWASDGGAAGCETDTANNDRSAADSAATGEGGSPEPDLGAVCVSAAFKSHVQLTSGGGSLTSPKYRLKLFIAPASPVGRTHSTTHHLVLGPASAFISLQEIP